MDKAELGRRLKAAREGAGLTQGALAQRVGAKQTTVSDWETGKNEPSLLMVSAIADACGWDLVFSLHPPDLRAPVAEVTAAMTDLEPAKLAALTQVARAMGILPARRCVRLAQEAANLVEDHLEEHKQ